MAFYFFQNVASFGITFPPLINNLSREITQQMHIMETDDCILTLQAMVKHTGCFKHTTELTEQNLFFHYYKS